MASSLVSSGEYRKKGRERKKKQKEGGHLSYGKVKRLCKIKHKSYL